MPVKQRILLIAGSRPEAVKLAPVAFALKQHPEQVTTLLCATGQQRDMLPQALAEFGLLPDIVLDVMQENQTLASLTSRLMVALDEVLCAEQPDWVLVQGDTTSAMVGALSAFYRRIPAGHIEAGMRTGNRFSPFPEEVNRRIISQCATLHFAATPLGRRNLLNEGVAESQVIVTGNTVIDALFWVRNQVRNGPSLLPQPLQEALANRRLLLVTSHRRENFGGGLESICQALQTLARRFADILIVYPVHPNPNVRATVQRLLSDESNLCLIEPQPYRAFVELMDRAYFVLTDSGGLQEEAPSLGKPVLVLRDTTERPEGIAAGNAVLVGTDADRIVASATDLLQNDTNYRRMAEVRNPYGDGQAAHRILAALLKE